MNPCEIADCNNNASFDSSFCEEHADYGDEVRLQESEAQDESASDKVDVQENQQQATGEAVEDSKKTNPLGVVNDTKEKINAVKQAGMQAKATIERVAWGFKAIVAMLANPVFWITLAVVIIVFIVTNGSLTAYQTFGAIENKDSTGAAVAADCTPIQKIPGACYPMTPTGNWHMTTYAGHAAEAKDIAGPEGTPLYAMAAGTIIFSEARAVGSWCPVTPQGPTQNEVTLEFDNPLEGTTYVRYVHLSEPSPLKVGDKVIAGDFIGYLGNTGCSTGPHLHIEFTSGTNINLADILGTLTF